MLVLGLLFMQSVEFVECNQKDLIVTDEQTTYHIDFFNVIFYKEENRLEACRYLEEAETIKIEEEKYVSNAYYIYVDGILLQEIIVDEGLGKQNIHYVDYLHNFEKKEQKVIANYENISRNNRSFYILGFLFLFLILSLFLTFVSKV